MSSANGHRSLAIVSKAPRSSLAKELARGRRKHTQLRHQSKRVHDDARVFNAALLQAVYDHAPNPDLTTGGRNAHKLASFACQSLRVEGLSYLEAEIGSTLLTGRRSRLLAN